MGKQLKSSHVREWSRQIAEIYRSHSILRGCLDGSADLRVSVTFKGKAVAISIPVHRMVVRAIVREARETYRKMRTSLEGDGVALPPGERREPPLLAFEKEGEDDE